MPEKEQNYIPISQLRQDSMDKSVLKLISVLNLVFGPDGYQVLEDSQSLTDVSDGFDFRFMNNGVWKTASARISDYGGRYISMRALRKTGNETELPKRCRAVNNNTTYPQIMFHFHMSAGKLTHFYTIKTAEFINFYKTNNVANYFCDVGNAVFLNIPAKLLIANGIKCFLSRDNEIVRATEEEI